MKKVEKVSIDPIKAKYLKKIGFFKKIQIKFNNLKNALKKSYEEEEDTQEFIQMIFNIVLFGVIGNLAIGLFGLPFSFLNILGIGCIAWLIENKLVKMLKEVLSSISIVKIYK